MNTYPIKEATHGVDTVFLVPQRHNPNDHFGATIHRSRGEAESQRVENQQRDQADADRLAKAKQAKAQADAEKARQRDTDGFAEQFPPMQRGRIISTLLRPVRRNGVVDSRRNHLRRLVAEGFTVSDDNRLVKGDVFFLPTDFTLTGVRYAKHLIERQQ
jgi:hypothetical protein